MNLRDLWRKYKDWFAVLVFTSVLAVCIILYLHLNPQHVPHFLTITIIAMGFVVVMALLPKYRRRLVKRVIEYRVKEKVIGRELYRYYRVALLVIIICALVFPVVLHYQLIASEYMPLFVLTFCVVNFAAGVIFVVGFLKAGGKWGVLLIAVIFASVLLGILIGWLTKHG